MRTVACDILPITYPPRTGRSIAWRVSNRLSQDHERSRAPCVSHASHDGEITPESDSYLDIGNM